MRQSQAAGQEVGRPQLIQSMIDAMRVPDLRDKILFTLSMLVVFRFVAHVPVPGVDTQALAQAFQSQALLGFLDLFSGGALANLSVAALGVYPYITASIVMQILTPVMPQLKALSQEGEYGRQRINQITHWLTVPIAVFQAFGQLSLLQSSNVLPNLRIGINLTTLAVVISMVAGTMFLVWLGELITERGLGNGISLIIFGGIVARLPQIIGQGFLEKDEASGLLLLVIVGFGIIYAIVLFNEAQRRVPVQYGRSIFRGGRMQRQSGSTFLPLRVNSAGMIPLIFAFYIIILPATIASQLLQKSPERRLCFPVRTLFCGHPRPGTVSILGGCVRAGRHLHVLLYAHNLPAAEPGREPSTKRRIHPRYPPGPSDPGVSKHRDHPNNLGRSPVPRDCRYYAILRHADHRRARPYAEQHQPADHGRRRARHHAPA